MSRNPCILGQDGPHQVSLAPDDEDSWPAILFLVCVVLPITVAIGLGVLICDRARSIGQWVRRRA